MSHASRIGAALLTAGESSRMGVPKALLPLGESTFIEQIFTTLHQAAVSDICIVAGRHLEAISLRHPELRHLLIRNREPQKGQLHSLRLALEVLEHRVDAVLMMLVDHPRVAADTLRKLAGAWRTSGKAIAIPVYKGKRGHPALLGWQVFSELHTIALEHGAKPVMRRDPNRVVEVAVDDPAVIEDIDTPQDYQRMQNDV